MAHVSVQLPEGYPGLSVNLVTASPAPDLIFNGLDVALRFGDIEVLGLCSQRIRSMPVTVCAARNCLNRAGRPTHPDKLKKFDWLEYDIQPDNISNLTSPDGVQISPCPKGHYATNAPLALID